MNAELQKQIVGFLTENGVKAGIVGPCVAVDRDSMCQSQYRGSGIPEMVTYPNVLTALSKRFEDARLYWCGKTDDDLFLDDLRSV